MTGVIHMQQTHTMDYWSLLNEIEGVLTRLHRQREHAVMAQPYMLGRPTTFQSTGQSPSKIKARLEKLPDFKEQMQSNPRFRRIYERVCTALDL